MNNSKIILETIEEMETTLSKLQDSLNRTRVLIEYQENIMRLNDENHNLLLQYRIIFENHIMWQSRKEYFEMIDNFLSGKIDGTNFCDSFNTLRYQNIDKVNQVEKNLKNKIDFQLTSESIGFSILIERLFALAERFDDGLKDNELKSDIKANILPKFSKYYDPN